MVMGYFSLVHNLRHIILKRKELEYFYLSLQNVRLLRRNHVLVVTAKYPNFAAANRVVVNLTKFLCDPYYFLKCGTNTNL